MDAASPLGTEIGRASVILRATPAAVTLGIVLLASASAARSASADERYALVISGASGLQKYAGNYNRWRAAFTSTLRTTLRFRDDHLIVLAEVPGLGVGRASRDGARRAFEPLHVRMATGALSLIVLIGHGTYDGIDARFNLVGPDLEASDWAELLNGLPERVVIVNTTGASFPFLERLAGPGRIVITATNSTTQDFETIFPQFFTQAFDNPASDVDKNGRVSIWEAFSFASFGVKAWYAQQGRLSTDRALLDDTGDGIGTEADTPRADGAMARRVYLDPTIETTAVSDPILADLLDRRARLES